MTSSVETTYEVHLDRDDAGWTVRIVDPSGIGVFARPCADETEATTFASTVRQHLRWLSPEKFREYYRLGST